MPNIKSAIKRMKQNQTRRALNRQNRSQMRSTIKKYRGMLAEGELQQAREYLPEVYSVIDKKVQKGVVHRNAAARYKARLTQHLNRLDSQA